MYFFLSSLFRIAAIILPSGETVKQDYFLEPGTPSGTMSYVL